MLQTFVLFNPLIGPMPTADFDSGFDIDPEGRRNGKSYICASEMSLVNRIENKVL